MTRKSFFAIESFSGNAWGRICYQVATSADEAIAKFRATSDDPSKYTLRATWYCYGAE